MVWTKILCFWRKKYGQPFLIKFDAILEDVFLAEMAEIFLLIYGWDTVRINHQLID